MRKGWSEVALGEVLEPVARFEDRDELALYQFAGTYSYARGVFRGDLKSGSSFNLPKIQRISSGDFIYCKIMAWEGAFGLAGDDVDGCVMSGAFVTYRPNTAYVEPQFLAYWFKCEANWRSVAAGSTGTNVRRKSLHPDSFAKAVIMLPPLAEQQRIVAHLEAIEARLSRVQEIRVDQEQELQAALRAAFHKIKAKSEWIEMGEVAPLTRRAIEIEPDGQYPALGARSFGKGIFHKPTLTGADLSWQKLFLVHDGDIVISNIKAWEGAIAVAGETDHNRCGSHRYLTCVVDSKRALAEFVCFYLLTHDGLEKIGKASPGSADRNRTLSVKRLEKILVPIPPLEIQQEFKSLLDLRNKVQSEARKARERQDALFPSLLDRVFNS